MEIAIVFYIILAGVIIYVLGEIVVKIVIDPVQELKRVIADIAFKLIHYSHVFKLSTAEDTSEEASEKTIDREKLEQAADEYRKLASMLNAGFRLVPFYAFARVLFFLPREADIIDARNELIEMSEEIFAAPKSFVIAERRKRIEKKLKVI
jgi:cell shape-determining protein MreC